MTAPNLIIAILISTLYGALFHVWRGGNAGRLILYLIFSWIGFWLGHLLGSLLDVKFLNLGPLHLGPATLGSFAALFLGYWLSLIQPVESR